MSRRNDLHPLDKHHRGESDAALRALRDYARMGEKRSLRRLADRYKAAPSSSRDLTAETDPTAEPPTRSLHTLEAWSDRYGWVARVDRYEAILREEDDRLWEARRRQVRKADYDLGEKLRRLAEDTLDEGPRFIKTRRRVIPATDSTPMREVITLSLDLHGVVNAARTASQIQRTAAEMHTVDDYGPTGALRDFIASVADVRRAEYERDRDRDSPTDNDPPDDE